jgi:hypothetical protein
MEIKVLSILLFWGADIIYVTSILGCGEMISQGCSSPLPPGSRIPNIYGCLNSRMPLQIIILAAVTAVFVPVSYADI